MKVRIVVERVSCEALPLTGAQAVRLREALGDALREAVLARIAPGGGRAALPEPMLERSRQLAVGLPAHDPAGVARGVGQAVIGAVWSPAHAPVSPARRT
ncbi:hypothetical protein FSB08_17110 [Paraburkholderia sp. JPY432]|uniref:hypothetical protein n=1 Tax=Paraburkholderia youngii TaxID=2782701 RepID=UPI00159561D8|nr:hypothetical protein [Paraburkholderia youngii]NVH74222.1 hypothetical protein [Paraburkholderia youngii]